MSDIDSGAVELSDVTRAWLAHYRQLGKTIDQLEEERKLARSHIEAALGDAQVGRVNGQDVVRWTLVESSRVDTKKLKADWPQIAEQYVVLQTTRRFSPVELDQ